MNEQNIWAMTVIGGTLTVMNVVLTSAGLEKASRYGEVEEKPRKRRPERVEMKSGHMGMRTGKRVTLGEEVAIEIERVPRRKEKGHCDDEAKEKQSSRREEREEKVKRKVNRKEKCERRERRLRKQRKKKRGDDGGGFSVIAV